MQEWFVLDNPSGARRKKRRKKKASRKRPTRKRSKGVAKTRKRRKTTRKKTKRRAAPRRKAKKRTTKRKKAPRRRARRRSSSTTKRRRRRNPPKARRASRRRYSKKRRKNPRRSYSRGWGGKVRRIFSADNLAATANGVAGFGLALSIPGLAVKTLKLNSKWNRGGYGIALSLGATILASSAATAAGFKKAGKSMFVGGMIATGLRVLLALLPSATARKLVPLDVLTGAGSSTTTTTPSTSSALSRVRSSLRGAGMGIMTPEQLAAGETGVGDYLALSSGYPNDGFSGVGNYLAFDEVSHIPQAIAASSWAPSAGEAF